MAATKPRRKLAFIPIKRGGDRTVREHRADPTRWAVRTRPALGLCVIWDDSYGERVWQQAHYPNQKAQTCAKCGRRYAKGTDRMWRNQAYPKHRSIRICGDCVTKGAVFLHE